MNFKSFTATCLCILFLLSCTSCGIHLDLSMSEDTPPSSSQENTPPSSDTNEKEPDDVFTVKIDPNLTGVWLAKVDFSKAIQDTLTANINAEILQFMNFDNLHFVFGIQMTFTEDGRVIGAANEEICQQSVNELTDFYARGMKAYLRNFFETEAKKQGLTFDQYFSKANIEDGDAYIDSTIEEEIKKANFSNIMDSMKESFAQNEYYGVKGDRLYTYEQTPDESDYMLYSVAEGRFLLDCSLEDKLDPNMPSGLEFPLVFEKVTE